MRVRPDLIDVDHDIVWGFCFGSWHGTQQCALILIDLGAMMVVYCSQWA